MYSSNKRSAARMARVEFSRIGWREFAKLNRSLGTRYLRAFVLRRELALYIAAYEADGFTLDTECQEVHYEQGICLLLRKMNGVWYIVEIFAVTEATGFEPVFCWQLICRGIHCILAHFLVGWRRLTIRTVELI